MYMYIVYYTHEIFNLYRITFPNLICLTVINRNSNISCDTFIFMYYF